MIQTVTKFDGQISISIILGILFLIGLIYLNPKIDTSSNKYRRLDYIGSLFFLILSATGFFGSRLGIFDLTPKIGILSIGMFTSMVFMAGWFLWSGIINVHFRKEISDDTSYKFGVSSFISGWIIIFYLIAESLR